MLISRPKVAQLIRESGGQGPLGIENKELWGCDEELEPGILVSLRRGASDRSVEGPKTLAGGDQRLLRAVQLADVGPAARQRQGRTL